MLSYKLYLIIALIVSIPGKFPTQVAFGFATNNDVGNYIDFVFKIECQ